MKHTKRLIGILLVLVFAAAGIAGYLLTRHTSDRRLKDRYDGTIPAYIAQSDMDGDGLDDQSDILASALAYLSTRPKYKSAYYAGGWPDDGYGVCTDVVAFALKGAGYDLSMLVDEDIQNHAEEYADEVHDANIDFRRVRNLKIFFARNAETLTDDLSQIEEWQGGDIVIFKDHIGIVSDRRNKDGVPYLIHHASPVQRYYEEDVLARRTDLEAHYRFPKGS